MDELQKKILKILEKDCKTSPDNIALILETDVQTVIENIKIMEDNKTIVKYKAMINWEKTTDDTVTAFIELKVTPQRGQGFDRVAERIYQYPQVEAVYLMSGGYDIAVIIEGKTMKEVALFVAEKLAPMEFVVSTATHFVLKKYKDDGVILMQPSHDERQVITL